ncbi:MAG: hypothetical protein ABIH20_02420 [Candidatus Diapherotrites archaeon]
METENEINSNQKENPNTASIKAKKPKASFNPIIISIVAIVIVGAFALLFFNQPTNPLIVLSDEPVVSDTELPLADVKEDSRVLPTEFAVRQQYFEEAFKPKRDEYDLFESAADHLGIPIEDVPEYFTLNSEYEIFDQLPPIPEDFSEVSFLFANGRTYDIGSFSEEYFLQPEFYPNFKEIGLRYWAKPDAKYWGTSGYGSYPAEQFDTLSLSGRTDFTAVVFFYTSYGVQTYQGTSIIPTKETLENFDVEITPDTFVLTPTFPRFSADWGRQLVIKGKLKEGKPPGQYSVNFSIVAPPIEKKREWSFKYRNLYFDASNTVAPSGFPINFIINVIE